MGLDRFMDTDSEEKKPKKKTKKASKTKTSSKEKNPEVFTTESVKKLSKPKETPKSESIKEESQRESLPSFTFVSMTFKCTKCKYKKNMKRPQSFTPSEKDLICPKCGAALKKSRSK
jgi:hypothetical protein